MSMTEKLQSEIKTIVKTLADTGMASKIILFGSMARGENLPNSDIDLCVLTPITDRRPIDITIDLRKAIRKLQKTSLDLLTYHQDEFAYHAARPTSFEHEIDKEGVVVYER